ncbi:uncharacterized protein LOC112350060 [Selaginella moellendorffii]|uniref:uncharacterized protein LOC112350060 n=1 Tax=Selaginella moellendorffii TaxID=88036 RepID=UPI000D1C44E8|nr:uncharacterized protein LOC112350060 [Selaginella moellendorffii]|eukprot:XP_024541313.1 uncharacterized protein LOC112350060 [Selaginella moellendorffii]
MLGRIVAAQRPISICSNARYDEEERTSVWDSSNVKSVRHRNRVRFIKESTWNTQNGYSNRRSKFHDNEERSKRWEFPRDQEDEDFDDYDEEEDDEEEEDEDQIDFRAVLGLFGIGLPVAFIAVPWLINHPMALTMVLALPPLVQRAFRFAVDVTSSFSRSRSRFRERYRSRFAGPARRRYQRSRTMDRDEEMDPRHGNGGMDRRYRDGERSQSYRTYKRGGKEVDLDSTYTSDRRTRGGDTSDDEIGGVSSWDISNESKEEQGSMEGWIELENDRKLQFRRTRRVAKARMRRLQRRKDISLFWRFFLSAFPFLRSWGGFL